MRGLFFQCGKHEPVFAGPFDRNCVALEKQYQADVSMTMNVILFGMTDNNLTSITIDQDK